MIKRIIVGAIAALLFSVNANLSQAQNSFKQEILIGGSFGTTFSSVSFAPYKVSTKMLMGYTGGITARWLTEKHLGLQAEINYTQYGWDEKFDDPKYQYSRTINYVEMPILTHIYFGNRRVRVTLSLGPKIGYLISEKTNENLKGAEPGRTNEQHTMPVEQKFDWGLCGGPGLELHTGIGTFQVEGRYYFGLSNIYHSTKSDYFSKSAHQVISAKVVYLLPLKR